MDQILDIFETSLEKIIQSTADEPVALIGGEKIYHDTTPVELLSSIEGLAMAEQMPTHTQVASAATQAAILDIQVPVDDFSQDDESSSL